MLSTNMHSSRRPRRSAPASGRPTNCFVRIERTPMPSTRYHKVRIGNHTLHPETLMLGYGYDPALSEGSVKPPVFLTSTFVFRTAEEGRDFFDYTSGRREAP